MYNIANMGFTIHLLKLSKYSEIYVTEHFYVKCVNFSFQVMYKNYVCFERTQCTHSNTIKTNFVRYSKKFA